MSEIPIPQLRVEIFPQPKFADDNLEDGWSKTSGGTSTFTTDGDIASLNKGNQAACIIEKTFTSIDTDDYPKLAIKVTAVNGTLGLYVWNGSAWEWLLEITSTGITNLTLPGATTISKIRFSASNTASIDYVFIMKNTMIIPTDSDDVVNQGTITLPLLENGVGGAEFIINNASGAYTGVISSFDRVIVYLWRLGSTVKKVFGGVVTETPYEGHPKDSDYYIHLKCMDLGEQLNNSESLIQHVYSSVNGKIIIQDAVAACSRLTDAFVDVDSDIASLHDVTYDEVLPYSIITEIGKKATTVGGVVGFDSYVDPAGNMHLFARGKYNSTVDLTEKIEEYSHPIDSHSIKNKQTVYGKNIKTYPDTGDDWTESLAGWNIGGGTLTLDGSNKKIGSYSLHMSGAWIYRYFSVTKCDVPFKNKYPNLIFWLKCQGIGSGFSLILYAPDMSNYFSLWVENGLVTTDWKLETITLGPANTDGWSSYGTPSWDNVQGIRILGDGDIWLDWLHFGVAYHNATVSDSLSIGKYGIRCAAPSEDDTLDSDDECSMKAASLISMEKESTESFTITMDGDNDFIPGYRQLVVISNDNVNAYYRILEIQHTLYGVDWMVTLKLSNEPILIDYLTLRTAPFQGISTASLTSFGERIVTQHKVSAPALAGATVRVPADVFTLRTASDAM